MIKKSLLLLALMCGSAAAVAPANVSKTSVNDFLKVAEQEEVKMHAMGDDAFMEKTDDRVAYDKVDTMTFSFAGIKTNSFRMVKDGIEVELDVDKEHEEVTAHVEFLNESGRFELVADDGESIAVFFVKDGDKYVTSVADKETAIHNADVLNGINELDEGSLIDTKSIIKSDLIDLDKVDLRKIEFPDERIKYIDFDEFKPVILKSLMSVDAELKYTDDYGVTFPLRGVKVEIHNVTSSGDAVISTGYTNDNGHIGYLTLAAKVVQDGDKLTLVRASSTGTYYFKVISEGTAIKVVDETSTQYEWQSEEVTPTALSNTNIEHTFTMDTTVGKGMAITQPTIMASNYIKFLNDGEDIRMCTLKYPGATSGCYYGGNFINIAPRDNSSALNYRPNPYEDYDVIGHEYGHHVQSVFHISHNTGGTHYSRHNAEDDNYNQLNSDGTHVYTEAQSRDRGMRLAYAEGWATCYSLMAQKHFKDVYDGAKFFGDDRYTAANGVNVGYGNYEVCLGEGAEESVTSFIWNVFDDDDENDPVENFCYDEYFFWHWSNNDFYYFDDWCTLFEDVEPDEDTLGRLLEKLKMAPTNVHFVGNVYTNVSPVIEFTCAGGSRYFTNNEFYVYIQASNHDTWESQTASVELTVTGTPEKASVRIPMEDWSRIVSVDTDEIEVTVRGWVNRGGIRTGGYETQYYHFPMPTQEKIGPDPVTMTPANWGFEQQYFNVVKTKIFDLEEVDLSTERLRTGRIESNQIVMSAKKKNAGKAYFRITSDTPIDYVSYDISLWSASEGINANNSTITVETMNAVGDWTVDKDLWHDVTLPTDRNNMITLTTNNADAIYGIKFTVTAPATGSSNNGRVALRNITFNF